MFFDARAFGALCDGKTDDTAAIQAAINAAHEAGGGVVHLPGGHHKIRVTQIGMRAGVTLRGAGPGATSLLGTDRAKHVIVIDESAGPVDQFVIEELKVEGGLNGLHLKHTNNRTQLSFARGVIRHVYAINCTGAGFYLDSGCLEYRVENCHAKSCGGEGFRAQSTDHFFTQCTAQATGGPGFRINGANSHFTNCKAFGSSSVGWSLGGGGRHALAACASQENGSNGFNISAASNILTGCLADSNGGVGFNITSTDHHTLTGCHSTSTPGLAYKHKYGYRIAPGGNRDASLVGCNAREAVPIDPSSDLTGCTVTAPLG